MIHNETVVQERLSIQEIALFIGCDVLVTPEEHFAYRSQLCGILSPDSVQLSNGSTYPMEYIRPILQPLAKLNSRDLQFLSDIDDEGLDIPSIETYWKNCAHLTLHLISQRFDIFDWIPRGLAVDKTKM